MGRKPQDIERICIRLIKGEYGLAALEVDFNEFYQFYTTMVRLTKTDPVVSFVNLGTIVVAQFSSISPQHFDIVHEDGFFTEGNFEFVIRKRWYGARSTPQSFWRFLWGEFRLNWKKLSFVFVISALLFFVINDIGFYEDMVSLLIQSATVFLSIYIIFTVSQSQILYKDVSLFKQGILQQYYQDDKHIALLGIITIGFALLGNGMVLLTDRIDKAVSAKWIPLSMQVTRALMLALVVMMLFDTFFAVTNYYLFRNRDVLERDMTADILDKDYREYGEQ